MGTSLRGAESGNRRQNVPRYRRWMKRDLSCGVRGADLGHDSRLDRVASPYFSECRCADIAHPGTGVAGDGRRSTRVSGAGASGRPWVSLVFRSSLRRGRERHRHKRKSRGLSQDWTPEEVRSDAVGGAGERKEGSLWFTRGSGAHGHAPAPEESLGRPGEYVPKTKTAL